MDRQMNILQIGNAKSGNFWLYNILHHILLAAEIPQRSFIQNHPIYELAKTWKLSFKEQASVNNIMVTSNQIYFRISSIFKMPIENIDDYVNQCSHVWLQSPPVDKAKDVLKKFSKVIYIIRDPRDIAISNSRYAFTPYKEAVYPQDVKDPQTYLDKNLKHELALWVQHVSGYLKLKDQFNMHIIFYERLLNDFSSELKRLLTYLEIPLHQEARERVGKKISFQTMKKKNPHHVRKGESSGWKNVLNKRQKKLSIRIAGPLLKMLHYSLHDEDRDLPSMKGLHQDRLSHAIRHAGRHFTISRLLDKLA